MPELRHDDALGDLSRALRRLRLHPALLRRRSLQLSLLLVSKITAANAALLADLAEDRPRFAHGTAVAAVLVGLTELAALVLPVGRVRHRESDP